MAGRHFVSASEHVKCVGHCTTLSDVPDAREQFTVRLKPDALAEVRRLADAETEGNASMMIRKLLSEALAARAKGKR